MKISFPLLSSQLAFLCLFACSPPADKAAPPKKLAEEAPKQPAKPQFIDWYDLEGEHSIQQIGSDSVHHVTRTDGRKARELRATYFSTFTEINETLAAEDQPRPVAQKPEIWQLESRLPTRISLDNTVIRSLFTRPVAETDLEALPTAASLNAKSWDSLYDALPELRDLPTRVSPFFDVLYDVKEAYFLKTIRSQRASFYPWTIIYDCDTVLEIGEPTAPAGQRILFFQSDLDIDADGSDGARLNDPKSYSKDGAFQPETSYRWRDKPAVENPFLEKWITREQQADSHIKRLENDLAQWKQLQETSYGHQVDENIAETTKELGTQQYLKKKAAKRVSDLTNSRHLIGEVDPFIVIPLSWTDSKYSDLPFAPKVGDFAMVFYGKKMYPCIFADQGPRRKTGEASLALARQITADNPRLQKRKLSAVNSPFWDLEVSYLVFPHTADDASTWGVPDLKKWNRKGAKLIEQLGGLAEGFTLHRWEANHDE